MTWIICPLFYQPAADASSLPDFLIGLRSSRHFWSDLSFVRRGRCGRKVIRRHCELMSGLRWHAWTLLDHSSQSHRPIVPGFCSAAGDPTMFHISARRRAGEVGGLRAHHQTRVHDADTAHPAHQPLQRYLHPQLHAPQAQNKPHLRRPYRRRRHIQSSALHLFSTHAHHVVRRLVRSSGLHRGA